MKVEIETFGGASGTIVAECPGYNAAWFLAITVVRGTLSFKSVKIIRDDGAVEEWT
jgi:hypothetical protein